MGLSDTDMQGRRIMYITLTREKTLTKYLYNTDAVIQYCTKGSGV